MKKSLMALAVAGALAPAVAMADASTVTLYGTLNIDFENVRADGASDIAPGISGINLPSRNRVSSNSSNIGFRGIEPLTRGLNAIFQVESSVALDVGTGSTLAGRNSNVGLSGGFGTVFLGQWDTPYKVSTGRLDPFGNTTIAGYTDILGGNGTATAANAANRNAFDRRQRNVVQYWTPNWAGFSARAAYGANEEKANATAITPQQDPRMWSVSLAWENGPFYVAGAWERHDDYGNTGNSLIGTTTTKDDGYKLGAGFTFAGNHTIGVVAERIKYKGNIAGAALPKTITGTPSEAKLDTGYISYLGRFGAHNVRAAYGQNRELDVNNGASAPGTKARFFALGYGYNLSKRTEVYALYTQIRNDENSRNDFAVNPIGLTDASDGADPRGFGVGFRHTF